MFWDYATWAYIISLHSSHAYALTLLESLLELLVLMINAIRHGTGLSLQMLFDDISKRFPPFLNQVRMLQQM